MKFTAKIYKMGKSGRFALMLPKGVVITPGEFEIDIPVIPDAPVETPAPAPEVPATEG